MSTPEAPIILFHYTFSPWSQKVTAYLSLRGIPYTSCHQPVTQPRPNMVDLGVNYRRIPVMSIGRDIYCDTLLILEKLNELYPATKDAPGLTVTKPQDRALERLLEKWTDAVVFKYAAAAIPTSSPIMSDTTFTDDRKELWGRDWTKEHQNSLRPEALVVLRSNMQFLENDLLTNGRDWIFEGQGPTLADIHAAWIFKWLAHDIEGSLPSELFSAKLFPKTYAWFDRYSAAVSQAMEKMQADGKVRSLEGDDAVREIVAGPLGEKKLQIDPQDPTGLKEGEPVIGYPQDTGFTRKDRGSLVGLTGQEVVISSKSKSGAEIRIC